MNNVAATYVDIEKSLTRFTFGVDATQYGSALPRSASVKLLKLASRLRELELQSFFVSANEFPRRTPKAVSPKELVQCITARPFASAYHLDITPSNPQGFNASFSRQMAMHEAAHMTLAKRRRNRRYVQGSITLGSGSTDYDLDQIWTSFKVLGRLNLLHAASHSVLRSCAMSLGSRVGSFAGGGGILR